MNWSSKEEGARGLEGEGGERGKMKIPWNLRFLYVTVSTLKPIARRVREGGKLVW